MVLIICETWSVCVECKVRIKKGEPMIFKDCKGYRSGRDYRCCASCLKKMARKVKPKFEREIDSRKVLKVI
jgi:hypothetical protein